MIRIGFYSAHERKKMFIDSERILQDSTDSTRVVFGKPLFFKTSVKKDSTGDYGGKNFKITIERAGSPIGSTDINISSVLNEVYGKNYLVMEVRKEFEFEDCDAYLEVLITPNLKGKCEQEGLKLMSQ